MGDKAPNVKLLITGASGFLGRHLCAAAVGKGIPIRRAVRRSTGSGDWGMGDISGKTDWSAALKGVDTVIHLAGRVHIMQDHGNHLLAEFRRVNAEGTFNLAIQAARAGARRFIFISSSKVNGEMTLPRIPFTTNDKPAPVGPYALSKYEAEQTLQTVNGKTGLEIVIIRPPLIYGPGAKANFRKLIEAVDRGIPLPFGSIQNRRSFLSLTNLVDLIYRCVEHPKAAGATFLASDGEDVSTPELVRRIAKALGRPAKLLPVPEWLMKLGGTITGKSAEVERLCGSLQIDSSKARRVLGWTPRCSMEEELRRVAEWWKSADFAD